MAFDSYSNVSKPYDTWNGGFSGDITAGSNGIASSPLSISSSSGSTGGGSILPELAQIKQQPQQDFSKGGHTRTMHLPAERTGAVIGKNGRMKHLIKEVCNVWMSIKSEPSDSDNSTRVCVIRGPTINNLDHAQSLINELLRDRETIEQSISLDTSDDVGRVIGSGGSNIQIIKDKTGAFVYVDKENVSAQYAGRCIIRGNSVQVLAAQKRVQELLARRDICADMGQQQQQPQQHVQQQQPTQRSKLQLGGMVQQFGIGRERLDVNDNEHSEIGVWNGASDWSSNKEQDRELERNAKKRIQDTILIPLQAVGMVIGKKGKNIKIIQETSGANVYIDKEYQGSDANAMCVIQGKNEQVSIAKVMIQEKLNQYNSANTFPIHDNDGLKIHAEQESGLGSPQSSSGSSVSHHHHQQQHQQQQHGFLSSPTTNKLMNSFMQQQPPTTPQQLHNQQMYQSPSMFSPNRQNQQQQQQQQRGGGNYFNFNIDHNNNGIEHQAPPPPPPSHQTDYYHQHSLREFDYQRPNAYSMPPGGSAGGVNALNDFPMPNNNNNQSSQPSSPHMSALGLDKLTLNITSNNGSKSSISNNNNVLMSNTQAKQIPIGFHKQQQRKQISTHHYPNWQT